MADNRVFVVDAVIDNIRKEDVSKTSKKLYYAYIDLTLTHSINKVDQNIILHVTKANIARKWMDGDDELRKGMTIKLELGVDKLERPATFYWIKRLD
jgi:heme oxygenase